MPNNYLSKKITFETTYIKTPAVSLTFYDNDGNVVFLPVSAQNITTKGFVIPNFTAEQEIKSVKWNVTGLSDIFEPILTNSEVQITPSSNPTPLRITKRNGITYVAVANKIIRSRQNSTQCDSDIQMYGSKTVFYDNVLYSCFMVDTSASSTTCYIYRYDTDTNAVTTSDSWTNTLKAEGTNNTILIASKLPDNSSRIIIGRRANKTSNVRIYNVSDTGVLGSYVTKNVADNLASGDLVTSNGLYILTKRDTSLWYLNPSDNSVTKVYDNSEEAYTSSTPLIFSGTTYSLSNKLLIARWDTSPSSFSSLRQIDVNNPTSGTYSYTDLFNTSGVNLLRNPTVLIDDKYVICGTGLAKVTIFNLKANTYLKTSLLPYIDEFYSMVSVQDKEYIYFTTHGGKNLWRCKKNLFVTNFIEKLFSQQ